MVIQKLQVVLVNGILQNPPVSVSIDSQLQGSFFFFFFFFRFCWTWNLKISKKRLFGLAARNRLSLSLPLSFSSSSYFISFSIQKGVISPHILRDFSAHFFIFFLMFVKLQNWNQLHFFEHVVDYYSDQLVFMTKISSIDGFVQRFTCVERPPGKSNPSPRQPRTLAEMFTHAHLLDFKSRNSCANSGLVTCAARQALLTASAVASCCSNWQRRRLFVKCVTITAKKSVCKNGHSLVDPPSRVFRIGLRMSLCRRSFLY